MDYTILDDGRTITLATEAVQVSATGSLRIAEGAFEESFGWKLNPEGLCATENGVDVCIPERDRGALLHDDGVDLVAFAKLLGRPIVVDANEQIAALGRAASAQAASMATLEAPEFELPDLAGELHTLSAHRGKKALLIVYASW